MLSKEELNVVKKNPAMLVIIGLKGKKGKEFVKSYEDEFDKKNIEPKSFKINKEITADKYFLGERVYYVLFSYNDQYYITIYSADKKQNFNEVEAIIKTITIKK
ncbi:hypothetical protein [Ruminiclostridium cellobioparum]|uniref:hypothetical protein n=1 Tax=Ruminiclostridium cellobioparum TaxID=29355 RepID=UPI0012B523CA|nr:hypothetical protein [Ruminiclostridium cellobioparum]